MQVGAGMQAGGQARRSGETNSGVSRAGVHGGVGGHQEAADAMRCDAGCQAGAAVLGHAGLERAKAAVRCGTAREGEASRWVARVVAGWLAALPSRCAAQTPSTALRETAKNNYPRTFNCLLRRRLHRTMEPSTIQQP